MQIIPQQNIIISDIVAALREGKAIVYPTETCYGLGCDATNAAAVNRVFQIKQRQEGKSVLMVMSDISMAKRYVAWTTKLEELAEKYWPGPLTIVASLINGHELAPGAVRDDRTIAFRVSGHPLAQELCGSLDRPLVSTSANIAAQESPYDSESVISMFGNKAVQPDIFIDAGELPHNTPSTIVRVVGVHVEVLRQGELIVE